MNPSSKLRGVAIACLREEDWSRWLALDSNFQPDYQHWLLRMEALFQQQQAIGNRVVKVTIEPDEFLDWIRSNHGGKIDSNARATFAAYKTMRKHTDH